MSGPPPSRLIFLSDLSQLKPGDKARFLGCVEEYQVSSGTVVLKHHYPPASPYITVHVNIDHVLETVKGGEMQVGSWVNIVGYITTGDKLEQSRSSALKFRKAKDSRRPPLVQAILLWSAGSINLDAYEKAVEQRKAFDSSLS